MAAHVITFYANDGAASASIGALQGPILHIRLKDADSNLERVT